MGGGIWDGAKKAGIGLGDFFINLSAEYGAILDFIYYAMGVLGVLIIISSLLEIARMGKVGHHERASFGGIFWKQIGGAFLIQLGGTAKMFTGSLWANYDPLDIGYYGAASSGAGDYSQQALTAAAGMLVLTGYVVLARAYMAIANLGKVPEEQRGEQWGFIISRIIAGSALISCLYLADLIGGYASADFKLTMNQWQTIDATVYGYGREGVLHENSLA